MKKIRTLTQEEHYNVCPCCGKEVSLFRDDDGDYCFGCLDCLDTSVSTFFLQCPAPNDADLYRPLWNLKALNVPYSQTVLDQIGLKDGDYVVSDTDDNYIVFHGDMRSMMRFFETELKDKKQKKVFEVFQNEGGRLVNLGRSLLFEIVWRYSAE